MFDKNVLRLRKISWGVKIRACGMQLGRFVTFSWPFYPGKMEAASVLAQMNGEPATALLLDIKPQSAVNLASTVGLL